MPVSAPFLLARSLSVLVLKHAEDFQRALAQPWLAKTPHFAVHHLSERVVSQPRPASRTALSSAPVSGDHQPVDNLFDNPVDKPVDSSPEAVWAGYVVPKRHARRAVTRNLIRRQMRQALANQQRVEPGLPGGLWVLRLRQGFDLKSYPSAASEPLRRLVRDELQRLMSLAQNRLHQRDVPAVAPNPGAGQP